MRSSLKSQALQLGIQQVLSTGQLSFPLGVPFLPFKQAFARQIFITSSVPGCQTVKVPDVWVLCSREETTSKPNSVQWRWSQESSQRNGAWLWGLAQGNLNSGAMRVYWCLTQISTLKS